MVLAALKLVAVRYRLGLATSEDLVRTADASVAAGFDAKSFILLAMESQPIMADVGPLFEKALRELSIALPETEEACWTLLRHHMTRIVDGEVDTRAGVQAILDEIFNPNHLERRDVKYVGDSYGLHHMLGNFYGIDDIEERPNGVLRWEVRSGGHQGC